MLFDIFFKTYTEKVWGMPTSAISADWAAQRIKGLSLWRAVWNALTAGLRTTAGPRGKVIKTLIDRFQYPRLGPGQMWEVARDRITTAGGECPWTAGWPGSSTTARVLGLRRPRRRGAGDLLSRPALPLDDAPAPTWSGR